MSWASKAGDAFVPAFDFMNHAALNSLETEAKNRQEQQKNGVA
jgi:hypothetical protein